MIVTEVDMHGAKKVNREQFFSLSRDPELLGHSMKLSGGRFKTDKRKNFFPWRIAKL